MEDQQPSMMALAEELAELRAAFAQQQATINALQAELRQRPSRSALAPSSTTPAQPGADSGADDDEIAPPHQVEQVEQEQRAGKGTSRRSLLRGAAAATAAAAVATVAAVGATEQAHAAPQAAGGNLVLGQTNDANAATILQPTSGSSPSSMLTINNPNARSAGITISTSSGVGVTATDSGTGVALYGRSTGGDGVSGVSSSGTGVSASSSTGIGVLGTSTSVYGDSSYGVQGESQSSYGVVGYSVSSDDLAAIGTGRIYQKLQQLQFGPPTSGTYMAGESLRDVVGDLWLCVGGDGRSVGQWAKVALLSPGAFAGGAITYLGKPLRIFDSRAGATDALFHPGRPCTSSAPTTVAIGDDVYQRISIPHAPSGAIGNVTVVAPSGAGYVALVPSSTGFQGTSNLNYYAGQTLANAFNVQLNGGALDIFIGGAATDVIIDLFAIVS